MTDKEKQIEEMAQDICGHCLKAIEEHECPRNEDKLCFNARIEEAKEYYNLGYRKIPKDSVVLTEEEIEQIEQEVEKETAKRILENLSLFMQGTTFRPQYMYSTVAKKLDNLAKQFGIVLFDEKGGGEE